MEPAQCVTVFLSLTLLWSGAEGQQCTNFQFTEQPPEDLGCNPYHMTENDEYVWQLSTSCTAVRVNENASAFQVRWYHEDTEGIVTDIGIPELFTSNINVKRVQFGNQLFNTTFTNDTLGEYWCQVVTEPDNVYLGRGNTVTILSPESYATDLPTCSGTITIDTTVCADDSGTNMPTSHTTIVDPSSSKTSYKTELAHPISSTQQTTVQGILTATESLQSQVVLQQSITNGVNNTYVNEDLPVKFIAGIAVSSLALILAIMLFGCLMVMLATPARRKRSALLVRRLSRTKMGQLVDVSSMRPNPIYRSVMIRNSGDEESNGSPDISRQGTQGRGSMNSVAGGVSPVTAPGGVQNHHYANVGIGQQHQNHNAKTQTQLPNGGMPNYENIPRTRDTVDHTYVNQGELAKKRTVNIGSHEYINVTVSPAVSVKDLHVLSLSNNNSQDEISRVRKASSHEYINVTITPAASVEELIPSSNNTKKAVEHSPDKPAETGPVNSSRSHEYINVTVTPATSAEDLLPNKIIEKTDEHSKDKQARTSDTRSSHEYINVTVTPAGSVEELSSLNKSVNSNSTEGNSNRPTS